MNIVITSDATTITLVYNDFATTIGHAYDTVFIDDVTISGGSGGSVKLDLDGSIIPLSFNNSPQAYTVDTVNAVAPTSPADLLAKLTAILQTSSGAGLTNAELRASPVPIDTTGLATSAGQVTSNAALASIDAKLTNPVPVSGTFFPGTQPVSGTFFQVTQPVSAASLPLPTGAAIAANQQTNALTDAQLRVTAVPVSGTFFQGTQPVSAASLPLPTGAATAANQQTNALTDVQLRATALPVSGTFFQGTQPVSGAFFQGTQPVSIAAAVLDKASDLQVANTGAAAAAVTVTLPAVASQFHYITHIEMECYTTVARTGGATPVIVTSTNLAGAPSWNFASAGAVGTIEKNMLEYSSPVRSSVVNTATTIVCPATASVIWKVKIFYYASL